MHRCRSRAVARTELDSGYRIRPGISAPGKRFLRGREGGRFVEGHAARRIWQDPGGREGASPSMRTSCTRLPELTEADETHREPSATRTYHRLPPVPTRSSPSSGFAPSRTLYSRSRCHHLYERNRRVACTV